MACAAESRRTASGSHRDHHAGATGELRRPARRGPAGLDRCDAGRSAQCCSSRTGEEVHGEDEGSCEMKRIVTLLVFALGTLLSYAASSHEMTMAEMELRETAPG